MMCLTEEKYAIRLCDLMFNPPPRILYLITELPELEEEEELLTRDIDNNKKICSEKAHKTDAGFDLRYSGQSPIVIAPHSLVKIDLKIALEIPVSTMIQIVFRLSFAKKRIDIKGGIINASYMENIIIMLQNNLDKPYKIESHEKIAQAIFLPLVKISQLVLVIIQKKLGLTVQRINGFGSSGKRNVTQYILKVNKRIQNQALVFEADPEICLLADITNLYLSAKAYKHFKILIHNSTEDIIEISEETLIGSISSDIQNSEKLHPILDFIQLFLFCNIISQV
ncbi:hypothetical protein G9A89_023061 [Geosiphon pyriformis]|nr:hypothetical protein G9A89_023061 [Geosiphon pyriformis]